MAKTMNRNELNSESESLGLRELILSNSDHYTLPPFWLNLNL